MIGNLVGGAAACKANIRVPQCRMSSSSTTSQISAMELMSALNGNGDTMSFDLLVFDPARVPNDDWDMRAWYDALVKWDHPDSNVTLAQTTPALRRFYKLLAPNFPPIASNHDDASKPASIMDRLKGLFSERKTIDPRFDEARFTDYSIAKDAIYLCFSWSVSEDATRSALDAAAEARVGFWNISERNSHPLRLPQQIKHLRSRLW